MICLKNDHGWADILAVIVFLVILIGVMYYFYSLGSPSNVDNIKSATVKMPVDYGNGVYYFRATSSDFAKSLSEFIGRNNVTVVSMSGDGNCGYGADCGYFVVVKHYETC